MTHGLVGQASSKSCLDDAVASVQAQDRADELLAAAGGVDDFAPDVLARSGVVEAFELDQRVVAFLRAFPARVPEEHAG